VLTVLEAKTFTLNDIKKRARIYFIGIGGISMNGLARLAKHAGFVVGGSDNHPSERTAILEEQGIVIYNSQIAANIDDFKPDYLVKTAAILPHNEEVKRASELGLQIFDRAEFLGAFTRTYKNVINVSGTHGKTTTTSMISMMMIEAGLDPTVHLGADLDIFNGTVRAGSEDLLVSEACEFNRSFLNFSSTTAVITNIDHDHVDCYPTIEDVIDVFARFVRLVDDDGYVVVSGHDRNIARALAEAKEYFDETGRRFPQVVTCATDDEVCEATGKKADFRAGNISFINGLPEFDIVIKDEASIKVSLNIPGSHNISNALNAAAAAYLNGASPEEIRDALNSFNGADGRYTVKGKYKGCDVVVDYAHHPTAARATIEAASNMPHNDILVVFQPLTFNRTKMLFEDYVTSLLPCKKILFAEIFSDREINTHEISSRDISDEINKRGGDAEFYEDREELKKRIDELIKPGDIILILGPEDIRTLGDELCP
jgi:UDP-N-acetylmuramate--alanine ligase